jgi:L-asparaginase
MMVLVITTGGTIGALAYKDTIHPPSVAAFPENGADLVREFIQSHEPKYDARFHACAPRDSKDIDQRYLENMRTIIANAPEDGVLITHGTDGILSTAEFLHTRALKKRLILTGAMIPLANGAVSDGRRNIEFALTQLSGGGLRQGIYVVLCDYELPGNVASAWKPRLYPFVPGRYKKLYMEDSRYNRLQETETP